MARSKRQSWPLPITAPSAVFHTVDHFLQENSLPSYCNDSWLCQVPCSPVFFLGFSRLYTTHFPPDRVISKVSYHWWPWIKIASTCIFTQHICDPAVYKIPKQLYQINLKANASQWTGLLWMLLVPCACPQAYTMYTYTHTHRSPKSEFKVILDTTGSPLPDPKSNWSLESFGSL